MDEICISYHDDLKAYLILPLSMDSMADRREALTNDADPFVVDFGSVLERLCRSSGKAVRFPLNKEAVS